MTTELTDDARARLARLRARHAKADSGSSTNKSKAAAKSDIGKREDQLLGLMVLMQKGEITEGQLLQRLRKEVLGISQTRFADMVGVSRKTIFGH